MDRDVTTALLFWLPIPLGCYVNLLLGVKCYTQNVTTISASLLITFDLLITSGLIAFSLKVEKVQRYSLVEHLSPKDCNSLTRNSLMNVLGF